VNPDDIASKGGDEFLNGSQEEEVKKNFEDGDEMGSEIREQPTNEMM